MAKALLFLPDITGFTKFVSETEIEHSQHIIAELLEILIDANLLDLQLAEIEGDALFFYREGPLPTQEEIQRQVEHMFLAFHKHLQLYEHQRICDCGACHGAVNLKLKFFAHAGNIQFIELKGFKKPHGKEVIVAHRLMKNQVPHPEYLLLSQNLADEFADWNARRELSFKRLSEEYDAGPVTYEYADISEIKTKLTAPGKYGGEIQTNHPMIVREEVQGKPEDVFEFISNFKYRALWNPQPKFIYKKDRVNRVGTDHVCVINNREIHLETITKPGTGDKLVYGEKTADVPLMKEMQSYMIVEPAGEGSIVTSEIHMIPKNVFGRIFKPLLMRQFKKNIVESLGHLKTIVESSSLKEIQAREKAQSHSVLETAGAPK